MALATQGILRPSVRASRLGRERNSRRTRGDDAVSEMPARDAKLVELLNEAYAKEKQLETLSPRTWR